MDPKDLKEISAIGAVCLMASGSLVQADGHQGASHFVRVRHEGQNHILWLRPAE